MLRDTRLPASCPSQGCSPWTSACERTASTSFLITSAVAVCTQTKWWPPPFFFSSFHPHFLFSILLVICYTDIGFPPLHWFHFMGPLTNHVFTFMRSRTWLTGPSDDEWLCCAFYSRRTNKKKIDLAFMSLHMQLTNAWSCFKKGDLQIVKSP